MTDAETMMALFEGSDVAYGSTELTGNVNTAGKQEAKCFVIRKPVTIGHWEMHLTGRNGLGILPINSRNMVRFGAIDVDIYSGLDMEKLNAKIQEYKIPMVLCRSKSGGPHLFIFFREAVPAKLAVEKLDAIAGFMGFGKSEIFPKQTSVAGSDVGNFINMPYFGGINFLRYGYDASGRALPDVQTFARYAADRSLDRAQLEAWSPPVVTGALPDGPPCLNRIIAERKGDTRNIVLANIAVYCKKAFPDEWEKKLDEFNQLFPQPLGSKEVEAIKKSYEKKDYRYQCNVDPLKTYCNSTACKKCKFGVGMQELMPETRSMTKINTVPPVWYVDVEDGAKETKRMSLTTEELQNPRLYQRKCMDTIQKMPKMVKPDEWQEYVAKLMEHCSVIDTPPENTPSGQFKEIVIEFLYNRASAESYDDMLRGLPHKNEMGFHFRAKDLWKYVGNQKFTLLKQNEMQAVLYRDMEAKKAFRKIKGTGVNYLTIQLPTETPESLEPTQSTTAY